MDEQQINDLDTARLALHGLLARNRSMQELNERLKGELQEALHREKLAQQQAAEAQSAAERAQAAGLDRRAIRERDKELAQLREEAVRRDRLIQELREQSDAAQLRASAQLADALDRSRAELQNAVHLAVQDKDALLKGMQLYASQQIAELKARCEALEREAAEKEQALTQEFHARNKTLSGQWKSREEALWEQTRKIQEKLETEMQQRLELHLTSVHQERRREKAEFDRKMIALDEQLAQRKELLRVEYEAREKEIRAVYEHSEADMERRLAERLPSAEQYHLQEKAALERQMQDVEAQWLRREAAVREEYANLETELRRMYETRETEIRADHHRRLVDVEADWAERTNKLQAEWSGLLRNERKKAAVQTAALRQEMEQRQQELAVQYETRLMELQRGHDPKEARTKALEAELERALAREHAFQEQLAAVERSVIEKERVLTQRLHAELERQNAVFAERMVELGKSAEINLQKLRDDYLARERALNARSADLHKRTLELLAAQERLQRDRPDASAA